MSAIMVDTPENREAFAAADAALVERIQKSLAQIGIGSSAKGDKSKASKEQPASDK